LTCAPILFCFLTTAAFAAVPTPESHFGHLIGADRQLLDWDKVVSYFYALSRSSDKIRVAEYGRTAEDRPLIVATIAAPDTLRKLDRYREIQRRLADPRITSPAQAEAMFKEGKNIVLMTCSIHANEVASTHSAVEFAYRLITENNPRFQTILDNTILLLVPSLNPDGVDIVTRWYRSTLGTKFEGTNPPELYHKYVGHDNNRDWYIFSQPETRATISQLHNVWHPEIVYDVHQQGAYASRMFIPPWLDPAEPNVDPILLQEMNAVGASMAADLTAAGKPGIAIHAAYDFWSPSRHYQAFHGGLRILTESASALLATPLTVAPDQIDENALGYKPREKSWNYIEPWLGGVWKLRDIIDYQELAFESLLHNAAVNREDMLRNFYRVGQHQVERASPAEIVVSKDQRDPGATRRMLETLAFGAVEIMRNGAGDYVIPMRQPYSGYAKALMERQQYPNLLLYPGGPPQRPYDVTAHTLPLLFGVDVKFADQAANERLIPIDLRELSLREPPPRDIYKASDTDAWKAVNASWAAGKPVWRNEAGDFAISQQPGAGWQEVKRPRIGLYKSFMADLDEGWTRWLLEQFGFAYSSLHNADVQTGNLRPVRLHCVSRRAVKRDRKRPSARNHAAGVHRRRGRTRRGGASGIRPCRRYAGFPEPRVGIRDREVRREGEECSGQRSRAGILFARLVTEREARSARSADARASGSNHDLVGSQSGLERGNGRGGSEISGKRRTRIRLVAGREAHYRQDRADS